MKINDVIYCHIIVLLYLLFTSINTYAVPATPYPISITQPDGSKLTIFLKGDEHFSYSLTEDGYLIEQATDGFYHYAILKENGAIQSTQTRVKPINKRTLAEKELLKNQEAFPDLGRFIRKQKIAKSIEATQAIQSFPKIGSPKSLVILVNFQDVQFVTPNPQEAFFNLLNEEGYSKNGATGSAKDYFYAASNGISSPNFVVVGPYTLPENMAYYGSNDNGGEDIRPREMIADACLTAHIHGVDFTQFDSDGDGIVDNVFVYYAGYNEAEGGSKNSIWPHRWYLEEPLAVGDVKVSGYACSSELRGNKGDNMCGIGTFAHEFGHVYGLPDYYPTNGANHHTLSQWSIMDSGAYLNEGRTPPTYSAYDRFYLGWLRPTLLSMPRYVSIPDLEDFNQAYLISSEETHNLKGKNPQPKEFFMLENRQKTGWDSFLPNSGMLITRINFNQSNWIDNAPNNVENAMGVDLIEADGIAGTGSLKGDPFPGSANITSYTPVLNDGSILHKPITNIQEIGAIIQFDFMGGGVSPKLTTNQNLLNPFLTQVGKPSETQDFTVAGTGLKSNIYIGFSFNANFEMRVKESMDTLWSKSLELIATDSIVLPTTISIRYNPQTASLDDVDYDYLFVASDQADFQQTVIKGISTPPLLNAPQVVRTIETNSIRSYTASWEAVENATGYYLTAFNTAAETNLEHIDDWIQALTEDLIDNFTENTTEDIQLDAYNLWTTDTSMEIELLIPGRSYFYFVKASDKAYNLNNTIKYENITAASEIVNVILSKENIVQINNKKQSLYVFIDAHKNIILDRGEHYTTDDKVYIYNLSGELIQEITTTERMILIEGLKPQQVYIIRTAKQAIKVGH